MSDFTNVYLITGFLGSGKTTFLNRIIQRFPKDKKLMILMNEFGEIGVDGTCIETDDLTMMEISKGSIFCVCVKTDFIKGLYEIAQKNAPDVLIIESTGVANPSDLKRDLKLPLFKNRFQFKEQFCVIDARNFLDAYEVYTSLEKQIASSTLFLINKIDQASRETIDQIKEIVRSLHPDPEFYETTYADIPVEKFFFSEAAATQAVAAVTSKTSPLLTPEELEQYLEEMLETITSEMTPPDRLMSAAYRWTGDDFAQIKVMAGHLPAAIIRAKGFLANRGSIYLFSYVMGDWSLESVEIPSDRIQHMNIIVFIGSPESIGALEGTLAPGSWSQVSTYQPPA
jgi:G3E family GTPase